jgi:hypothetical protein
VQEKKVSDFSDGEVTRIVISDDNLSYFIGTNVGSVHILNALDLSL